MQITETEAQLIVDAAINDNENLNIILLKDEFVIFLDKLSGYFRSIQEDVNVVLYFVPSNYINANKGVVANNDNLTRLEIAKLNVHAKG